MRPPAFTNGGHGRSPETAPHTVPLVSALVVEPVLSDALVVSSILAACHVHVTTAETFQKGRDRLNTRVPDILIAAIRLVEYNGLQLVLQAKALRPRIAAIVLSPTADPVLQSDSEGMGATFFVKPVVERELAALVWRSLFLQRSGTPAGPLRPPFERRLANRRFTVVTPPFERRRADRRRDLESLLREVSKN